MADPPPAEEMFSLYQEDIIHRLKDRDWFIDCIGHNFYWLANQWSCHVVLSERRLGEAYDFWQDDCARTLRSGIDGGSVELDHFKHASFIAFWLRRMIPINETYRDPDPEAHSSKEEQNFFLRYGNEICALLIGFQICLYYEMASISEESGDVVAPMADWEEMLRKTRFPPHIIRDFAMVLKHKNMSPHSLYLMFRSLFASLPIAP